MKPYAPDNNRGRNDAGHRVHHRTADNSKACARAFAKSLRHAARQEARRLIENNAE
jgi:hypothetical protein